MGWESDKNFSLVHDVVGDDNNIKIAKPGKKQKENLVGCKDEGKR